MLSFIRAIFLIFVAIVALAYTIIALRSATSENNPIIYYVMLGGVCTAFFVILLDVIFKKKNLTTLSGVLFGILVGIAIALCVGYLVDQIANVFLLKPVPTDATGTASMEAAQSYNDMILKLLQGLKLLVGLTVTYLTVSFILQTKDDFRFIIPYVEFSRAAKGPRPMLLDTSVIIDGRIADMATTGVFESPLIVPRFVLNELQTIADSGDRLKRSRGRRGLEILEKLKAMPKLELRFWDGTLGSMPESEGVDQKLVALAQQEGGRIVTNDYNLNKVASLRGVSVININSIADALKPVALPGETMKVRIVKPGEGPTQGVGYLEDGTMVVVEGARDKVGNEVELVVTNALQTAAGKMIFGRTDTGGHVPSNPGMAVKPHR